MVVSGMIAKPFWHRLLCSAGALLLTIGVCVLSLEAKAWVNSSQHQLGKHYKATETSEYRLKSPAAAIGLTPAALEPPPVHVEALPLLPRAVPLRPAPRHRSHALRAPPVPIPYEIVL